MKKLNIILVIISCLVFGIYSCSQDIDDMEETTKSFSESLDIAREYLDIVNDYYFLDLGVDEAEELGIPVEFYTQIVQGVEDQNLLIEELRSQGLNVEVSLNDNSENMEVVKTRSESDSVLARGLFNVLTTQNTYTISIPSGGKKLIFTATTGCVIASVSIMPVDDTYPTKVISNISGGSCSYDITSSPSVFSFKTNTVCSGGATLTYIVTK